MAKQPNIIELVRTEIQKELNSIKRHKRKLKLKVIFTLILPVVIVLLAVKTAQTYMKIRLKSILIPGEKSTVPQPMPIDAQRSRPEFITPEPVSQIIITELTEDV